MNKDGIIPPPPPSRPGEEEIIPPPAPFKEQCKKDCCLEVGKSIGIPMTCGSSDDAVPGLSAGAAIAMAEEEPEPNDLCITCQSPSKRMVCEVCAKRREGMQVSMSDALNPVPDGVLGGDYIGTGAPEREPELSEFAKAAIALKMKLHKEKKSQGTIAQRTR